MSFFDLLAVQAEILCPPFSTFFCGIWSYNLSFIHAAEKNPGAMYTALSELSFDVHNILLKLTVSLKVCPPFT